MSSTEERKHRFSRMHRETVVLVIATLAASLGMALLVAGFVYRFNINEQVKELAISNCVAIENIKAILLKNQLAADKNVEQLFPGQLWSREHARHAANIKSLMPIDCN